VIQASTGYDGPEINDFRDSGWDRESDRSGRDSSRRTGDNWQTREATRLKLERVREAESSSEQAIPRSREHLETARSTLSREDRQAAILKEPDRSQYTDRARTYALRPSEIHTLTEVGKFRVVGVEDLATFAYNGDRERMQSDLRSVSRQGLVEQRVTRTHFKTLRKVIMKQAI
jgi:hypothetical protein